MNKRIENLQKEINKLQDQLEAEELLQAIYLELGPYSPHLSFELDLKIRRHFNFDDSE